MKKLYANKGANIINNSMQEDHNIGYSNLFLMISVIFVTCLLLSNLIAGKLICVFGITLPAAVILFPITYILSDIFTEVYGFQRSRQIIWLGFACNVFAVLVYEATIALPYPDFWANQGAYAAVLGTTPRILVASLVGYLFGEFSNSIILSRMKVLTRGKWLWTRTISSSVVGQAFDTVIFITISFLGTYANNVILQMILFQYLWKLCYEIILTPATYAIVKWMKHKENNDIYDQGVTYNPFRFKGNQPQKTTE